MADFGSSKNPNSKLFIEQKGLSKQSRKRNKFCPKNDKIELRVFFCSVLSQKVFHGSTLHF